MTTPTAEDAFATLAGARFHYRAWRTAGAPALILLHGGSPSHAGDWDHLAPALADRYAVYALDQRGAGQTDGGDISSLDQPVTDLAAFVEAVAPPPVTLIGHSAGSVTAARYAAAHPDAVRRLVLIDQGPDTWELFWGMVGDRIPDERPSYATPQEAVAAVRATNRYAADALVEHIVRGSLVQRPDGRWVTRAPHAPAAVVRAAFDSFSPKHYWSLLPGITCPTLVVRGARSRLLTAETAGRMVETLRHGRLVEIPERAHRPLGQPRCLPRRRPRVPRRGWCMRRCRSKMAQGRAAQHGTERVGCLRWQRRRTRHSCARWASRC